MDTLWLILSPFLFIIITGLLLASRPVRRFTNWARRARYEQMRREGR